MDDEDDDEDIVPSAHVPFATFSDDADEEIDASENIISSENSSNKESSDPKNEMSPKDAIANRRNNKRHKKNLAMKTCFGKELKKVDMLGIIFLLNKIQYVLCPYCMHLMKHSTSRWTEIGIWCGTCLGGQKILAQQRGIIWDDDNSRPVDFTFPRKIGPYPLFWNPVDLCCIVCDSRSSDTRPMTFCLMFNDLTMLDKYISRNANMNGGETRQKMGYYPFCRKHAKPYLTMSPKCSRLSNILYINYRLSSALLQDDTSLAYSLEPRILNPEDGHISILDCMDSTALYSDVTHRERKRLCAGKKDTMTSIEYKKYKNNEWDPDVLFRHSSTSRLRKDYVEDGK
jgi:hypothetical protein